MAPVNGPAWKIGEPERSLISSSSIAAVAGYPSVAVPCALVDDMPVGVAFIGRRDTERLLLRVAARFEDARGGFRRPPDYTSE